MFSPAWTSFSLSISDPHWPSYLVSCNDFPNETDQWFDSGSLRSRGRTLIATWAKSRATAP